MHVFLKISPTIKLGMPKSEYHNLASKEKFKQFT